MIGRLQILKIITIILLIFICPVFTVVAFSQTGNYELQETGDFELQEVEDPTGRVILKNLGNNRFTFYAYQDGYHMYVGMGYLFLKSGYNYTFEEPVLPPTEIEVRRTSDDEFIGYALIIEQYALGSFAGWEKPVEFIDSNLDSIVSVNELEEAVNKLEGKIDSEHKREILSSIESNSKGIAEIYLETKNILGDQRNAPVAKKGDDAQIMLIVIVFISAVLIAVIIGILRKRLTKKFKEDVE